MYGGGVGEDILRLMMMEEISGDGEMAPARDGCCRQG